MRLSLIAPLIMLAVSSVAAANDGVAATPWYIGPKGGDVRKGHTVSPSELWASAHGTNTSTVVDASMTVKPWYIGPKGGDIRKGHTASPSELWAAAHGNESAPATGSTAAAPKPWYIGPKGGDTRKGSH
jgi:hypothetical protein